MRNLYILVYSTFNFQLKRELIFYLIFFEGVFLVTLVYLLFVIIFYKNINYLEMIRSYECGFDPRSSARLVFSYRFFLISILFIIFDVEISLIISIPFFIVRGLGVVIFYIFIFLLVIGLIYEYYYGSLDWLKYYRG